MSRTSNEQLMDMHQNHTASLFEKIAEEYGYPNAKEQSE